MQITPSSSSLMFALLLTTSSTRAAFLAPIRQVSSKRIVTHLSSTESKDWGSAFFENLQNAFSTVSSSTSPTKSPYYTIAITGSTGLVGTALRDEIAKRETVNGKPPKIIRLVRGSGTNDVPEGDELPDTLTWNPDATDAATALDPTLLRDIDAVVHLAGENVATGLGPLGPLGVQAWSDEKKSKIMDSRTKPSRALAEALQKADTPTTFVGASGVGIYGYDFFESSSEDRIADESSETATTDGFLAEVSRAWEAAENVADNGRNRVVNVRFGVVMSKSGGALQRLYPIFFLGGGGNVGSGRQYFSFVSARDIARAIVHVLETSSLKGPVNVCAPNPCTNAEFTKAMGKVMGRPTILPLPEFAVKLLFGEMGDEMLLGGVRVIPKKLLNSGFKFQHETIEEALQSAINEENI